MDSVVSYLHTYVVFPLPVGPRIAFKPGNIRPLVESDSMIVQPNLL